jgi:hypothetical protein
MDNDDDHQQQKDAQTRSSSKSKSKSKEPNQEVREDWIEINWNLFYSKLWPAIQRKYRAEVKDLSPSALFTEVCRLVMRFAYRHVWQKSLMYSKCESRYVSHHCVYMCMYICFTHAHRY